MEPGSTKLGLNYESSGSRQTGRVWEVFRNRKDGEAGAWEEGWGCTCLAMLFIKRGNTEGPKAAWERSILLNAYCM